MERPPAAPDQSSGHDHGANALGSSVLDEIGAGLRTLLSDSKFESRLEADVTRVALAYAEAMMLAQILEFTSKLVWTGLSVPPGGPEPDPQVARQMRRTFGDVSGRLAGIDRADLRTLASRIDDGRRCRNRLAHDYWFHALPEVLAGRTDELCSALDEDRACLTKAASELIDHVVPDIVGSRGVDLAQVGLLAGVITEIQVNRPDLFEGLHLIEDGGEVLERLVRLLHDG